MDSVQVTPDGLRAYGDQAQGWADDLLAIAPPLSHASGMASSRAAAEVHAAVRATSERMASHAARLGRKAHQVAQHYEDEDHDSAVSLQRAMP